jgi:hypothetical protein
MTNQELKESIRTAAVKAGVNGVMELTRMCDISYERVSRVWAGSTSAKISDVAHVADVLGFGIKFVKKGDL